MVSRPTIEGSGLSLPVLAARPPELEDWLNRNIYHPLAKLLAVRLARSTRVTPNQVSVAGLLLVWCAALAYTGLAWPLSAALGFLLHALWHVVDGADGDLARLTGRSSATGELVDGVCDYAGHVFLYVLLAALLDDWIGGWAWPLAVTAGASHIVQTHHAETRRRFYLWWAYGTPWLKHAQDAGDEVFHARNWFSLTFGWMARLYLRHAQSLTPGVGLVDARIAGLALDPVRLALARNLVRESCRTCLAYQKLVGPNPRTILLGVSMAAGSPIYFFVGEILLNFVLFLSIRHHEASSRALAAKLEELG